MREGPVMILAGGTGGHVFPALAVAEQLRAREVPVLWVGTRQGLEARVVPPAGFPIEWVRLTAPSRRGWRGLVGVAPAVLLAVLQGMRLLRRYRPTVVLGMGGYASSAVALAAVLWRIPLVIHEQNAIAGVTNRILARLAKRVLLGFPYAQGIKGGTHMGNPVRAALQQNPPPAAVLSGESALRLLIIGGSQGAEIFNEVVPQAIAALPEQYRPQIWHQTGSDPQSVAARYPSEAALRVSPFIEAMDEAYAWADLVLARAGAMTIAELAVVARAAVLVPYPYAADNHQMANARGYAETGAAEVWEQNQFTPARLAQRLRELAQDRAALQKMTRAARNQARPHAAAQVAACLLELRT